MTMLLITFSLLFLGFYASAFDPTTHTNWKLLDHFRCGNSNAGRIIGGRDAALGERPWLVRIGYTKAGTSEISYDCGGAILNNVTIITASHCFQGIDPKASPASIVVGEHDTETNPDCDVDGCADPIQVFKPWEIIIHSDYNRKPFQNDIALVRLKEPMQFNDYVVPICLMKGNRTENLVGKNVDVAGWGIYDFDEQKVSQVLQTLTMKVVSNARCKTSFSKLAPIGKKQMCVGGEVGSDSCNGDSGGPLTLVEGIDGPPRNYLVGIVSFGSKRCGVTTMPGVYTRITPYLQWIMDNLKESKVKYKRV